MAERLSHGERRDRRKRIAECVQNGASTAEAARLHGVTSSAVQVACSEHGVKLGRAKMVSADNLGVIAALCNTDDTLTDIARRRGVTLSRISQIYTGCVAAGIPVRVRPPYRHKKKG